MMFLKCFHFVIKHSVNATLLACCCASTMAQTPLSTASKLVGPGSLDGVWMGVVKRSSERGLRTVDGELPPLLPWAKELSEKRMRMTQEGSPFVGTNTLCLPSGVPGMMFGVSYPMQIIESSGQVTMLFEEQNHFRIIHMNAKHPVDPDPTYFGHSIGRWEGDTLVVDTVGLTERTTLDQTMPHSEELHVIERYRRTDKSTLEIILTFEDPKIFTKPWDTKITYKAAPAGMVVNEYICENNRDAPDAKGQTGFLKPVAKP